jgi:hypothetical protein
MKKLVIFFILILSINVFASKIDEKNIYSYFREEIQSISFDFKVLKSTRAKLSTGFKKKKFKLKSYDVKYFGKNVYKLVLNFKRKNGIFKYKRVEIVYFWLGKRKIVFLTNKGKYSFPINRNVKFVREKNFFKIVRERKEYHFKIKTSDGKIYLNMEL